MIILFFQIFGKYSYRILDSSDVSDDQEEETQTTAKNTPISSSTHHKIGNWEKYTKV